MADLVVRREGMGDGSWRHVPGALQVRRARAVWEELLALGAAVHEEPAHADALAVARETMKRARMNIDRLIPRLVRVGFLFGYGWLQPPASQPFGWREREWYRASLD
jgi:hypothetical protein